MLADFSLRLLSRCPRLSVRQCVFVIRKLGRDPKTPPQMSPGEILLGVRRWHSPWREAAFAAHANALAYEHPLVEPQSMHLVHVPLRTIDIEPQLSQASPV